MSDARTNILGNDDVARLRRSVEELSILNELARAISASFDTDEIMKEIVSRAVRAVHAEQASITPFDRHNKVTEQTLVHTGSGIMFHLQDGLVGMMLNHTQPVVINDAAHDERVQGIGLEEGVRNLVCAPMLVGEELVGVLVAYNRKDDLDFDEGDRRLLSIMAAQSAQVLERARLVGERDRTVRILNEIDMAKSIQTGLLPDGPPHIAGYDLAAGTRPVWAVGGDYYDFIALDDDRWGLALGDVSGKGVPAAMLMSHLQATLRGQALHDQDCAQCVTNCNRLLFAATEMTRFATLFYCVLDPLDHTLCFCNAGHEHPLILDPAGAVRTLTTGGLPVGLFDDAAYERSGTALLPGEMMVVYSDGVTDMADGRDEFFGTERLTALLQDLRTRPAAEVVETVIDEVRTFAGGEPPEDDVTILVVKRD